jgi:hypothetical protein
VVMQVLFHGLSFGRLLRDGALFLLLVTAPMQITPRKSRADMMP